jgi:hypothetical protein
MASDEPESHGVLSSPSHFAPAAGIGGFGSLPPPPAANRGLMGGLGAPQPYTPYMRNRIGGGTSTPHAPMGTPYQKRMFQPPPAPEPGPPANPSAVQQPPGFGDEADGAGARGACGTAVDLMATALFSQVDISVIVQHVRAEARLTTHDADCLKLVLDVGKPCAAITSPVDKEVSARPFVFGCCSACCCSRPVVFFASCGVASCSGACAAGRWMRHGVG